MNDEGNPTDQSDALPEKILDRSTNGEGTLQDERRVDQTGNFVEIAGNFVEIEGVRLKLSQPYSGSAQWIGQSEILLQLLACWITVDESDLPLTPRLVGSPGVGKTQLVIAAAKQQGLPLYIYQCTADTRPEDLLVTPVLGQGGSISYHASPLVSAMITGGICLLDEGNRMNEKSWASLAPLFDGRRMVESIVAGIQIPASLNFRAAITMNDDESTFEIPDYILSRLQPTLKVGFPNKQDEIYSQLLGDQSELTGASLQNSWQQTHQKTLQWVKASRRAGKPWVVANDEQNPADKGAPPDTGYKGFKSFYCPV